MINLFTKTQATALARAALEIHDQCGTDLFGSVESAENATSIEIVEICLDADRLYFILDNGELNDQWKAATCLDYEKAYTELAAEIGILTGVKK